MYAKSLISLTFMQGVFINPAFIEPFGLTLIEVLFLIIARSFVFMITSGFVPIVALFVEQAAAHGLPIVATKNGGPVDIHRVLPTHQKYI